MKKLKIWYKLKHTPRLSPLCKVKLIEDLGEPENFIGKGVEVFADIPYLNNTQKNYLASANFDSHIEKVCAEANKNKLGIVYLTDEIYPERLKQIDVPPLYFYYLGNYNKELFNRSIGFVGTRKPSNYGQLCARKFSKEASIKGFTIVSGMAYGIDAVSHKACLEAGGKTVAILGTGLDNIYPVAHQQLAIQIQKNGCVISEFDPLSVYNSGNFPTRNRIISGLSLGVVIVEGALKSGSLITARFAAEQNRDVFAVPGDIDRKSSAGPNYLIKNGAVPLINIDDITNMYELAFADEELSAFPKLDIEEQELYKQIEGQKGGITTDELSLKTGLDTSLIGLLILQLELKGVVKRMAGGKISALY